MPNPGHQQFPSNEHWTRLYLASALPALLDAVGALGGPPSRPTRTGGLTAFAATVTPKRLIGELHNRLVDVARSYVFMVFYYNQGIPDDRWYASPGAHGQSIEYFPDCEEEHFITKGWFDFYADTFYQKLFGWLDVVGHIVNARYALGLRTKEVSFVAATKHVAARYPGEVARALQDVVGDPHFTRARQLRNDITHNESPSTTGMTVSRRVEPRLVVLAFGVKVPVRAVETFEIATRMLALVESVIAAVRMLLGEDPPSSRHSPTKMATRP